MRREGKLTHQPAVFILGALSGNNVRTGTPCSMLAVKKCGSLFDFAPGMSSAEASLGRSALGVAFAVGVVWLLALGPVAAQDLLWSHLTEGLAVTVWEPGSECGDVVPASVIVKIDPERFRFATYHYLDEKLPAPLTIKEWQRRTGASVLFNAGLFRDDYTYLGWLFKDGRSLGSKRHPQWQGLFVAEPVLPGLRKARVLDLSMEPFAADHPAYREAAQSLMLLDRYGKPRVRQTGKRAHQTVVGEDREGNILLIKTGDAVALWELAACLRDRLPLIYQAMAMDGGASSDLLIKSRQPLALGQSSQASTLQTLIDGSGIGHIPLPSVIGVLPRSEGKE